MKRYEKDKEYLSIISNILENKEFKQMEDIKHHNTTRMNHLLKVSYKSYKVAKIFNLDYKDVARAGLLHDFYTEEVKRCNTIKDKVLLFSTKHPENAVENSMRNFELSEKEVNIIKTHMFPIDYKVPKYAESWIVSIVDKFVSVREFSHKFGYSLSYIFNLYLLFLLNVLK